MNIVHALERITGIPATPGAPWGVSDDGKGQYISRWDASLGEKPTVYAIAAGFIAYLKAKEATAYKEERRKLYASTEDQFDMQYHDLISGTATWRSHVAAVKLAFPKPEQEI